MKNSEKCRLLGVAVAATSVLSVFGVSTAHAVLTLDNTGTYSQNFDTLPSAANGTWTDDSTLPGWFAAKSGGTGGSGGITAINVGNGSSNAGALYSFGVAGVNPITDRALGSICSGPTGTITYGVLFQAPVGININNINVSYTGEQWRDGDNATGATQQLAVDYIVSTVQPGVIATNAGTSVSGLSFTSPTHSTTTTVSALDGNAAANRTAISAGLGATVNGGQYLLIRWTDVNDAGNDHGLALDDLTITWSQFTATAPSVLTWEGGSGTWDTGSTQKWANAAPPTVDSTWDNTANGTQTVATFVNANDSVTVQAGGITTNGLSFSADGVSLSGGPLTLNANTVSTTTGNTTINSQILGTVGMQISGGGTMILTNSSNSFSGNLGVAGSTLMITSNGVLGAAANVVSINGSTLVTTSPMTIAHTISVSGSSTLNDQGNDITIGAPLAGAGLLLVQGNGTITLATPSAPPTTPFSGNFNLTGGTLRIASVNTNNLTNIGTAAMKFDGGNLFLDGASAPGGNLQVGRFGLTGNNFAPGFMDIFPGTVINVSGNVSWQAASFSPVLSSSAGVYASDPNSPSTYTIHTLSSSTVLTLTSTFKQFDINGAGPQQYNPGVDVVTHISGTGRVVLQNGSSGGEAATTSEQIYGGDWSVDGGTLQVGPILQTPATYTTNNSQTINALGFKNPGGAQASDPDLANTVFVHAGGTLAIAVDQVNTDFVGDTKGNPYTTSTATTAYAINLTPDYIRNSVVLDGGSVAATGSEVTFNTVASGLPEGVPNGTPVVARFGGNFTVLATGGTIQVFDPIGGGARLVELDAGERTIVNASPAYGAGTVLDFSTAWAGTLIVDGGGTTGGIFNVNRDSVTGGVTVDATAKMNVINGATLKLTGVAALTDTTDPTKSVAISTDSTSSLLVTGSSSQTVGVVSGAGTTNVNAGSSLTATSISQSSVTDNGAVSVVSGTSLIGTITGTGSASIPSGATMKLSGSLSQLGALSVGGSLDLTISKLIVQDSTVNRAADLAALKALAQTTPTDMLLSNHITSSTAAAANTTAGKVVKVIAVSDNAIRMATFPAGSSNFGGVGNVDANSILITAAFKGDANLDGVVDIQDLTDVANHWQSAVTDWSQGDFDGSNFVDISDLTAVANNWQAGVGSGSESFSQALSLVGGFTPAAVPEPASLGLLGLGGLVLAGRRRNKR